MKVKSRLVCVAVFAIAMAWVEAAVVLYLRVLVGRLQPYQPDPLPRFGGLGQAELIREGATLLMLLAVGWLAGERVRTRLAFSAFAFGVWDIFYYVFLIPLTGWPHSFLDWDILFLVPVPWWGPVIAPVGISLLMIAEGLLVLFLEGKERPACLRLWAWPPALIGVAFMLYAFSADGFAAANLGAEGVRQVLPSVFRWLWFLSGWILTAVPVTAMAVQAVGLSKKKWAP
jgi:hypothetical protein